MTYLRSDIAACILAALALTISITHGQRKSYNGYSVLRVYPVTQDQLHELHNTMLATDQVESIQFWTEPTSLNKSVDILVDLERRGSLEDEFKQMDLPYVTMIPDLSQAIENSVPDEEPFISNSGNRSWCRQYFSAGKYHLQYHPYREIEMKLKELAELDSRISIEVAGKSSENRNIYLVKVSSNPQAKKPVILIDAGHHAREWISHSTVVYLLESLVNVDIPRIEPSACQSDSCRRLVRGSSRLDLDRYDFWFVPTVNPDGYEYTHTRDRLWRKTRSDGYCKGADPNRNYPFEWRVAGASPNSCSEIYAGPRPLSEPETRAIVNIMDSNKGRIIMYLSFHSYSQLLLTPYGYARVYPNNYKDMERVANGWIESVSKIRNTIYGFGPSAITLYPAAGGSDDYAHGSAGIPYAYTIELPDKGSRGFVLPPSEIIPVGYEALIGIKAMLEAMPMPPAL